MQIKEGHTDGFYTLRKVRRATLYRDEDAHTIDAQMLEVCIHLNIRCVSAYAFSIENFKRSPGEVEALMNLAEEKLLEFCEQGYPFLIAS